MSDTDTAYRNHLFAPIPELLQAARLLQQAVEAHIALRSADAIDLIRQADIPAIFDWSETLFGGKAISASIKAEVFRISDDPDKPAPVPKEAQVSATPPAVMRRHLIERDGYFYRYCGTPVIFQPAQAMLRKAYPDALRWGARNTEKHTAFQALDLDWEHVVPRSLGGQNTLDNLIVACSPCNTGKWNWSLAELALRDPRDQPVARAVAFQEWDGLTSIFQSKAG